MAEPEPMVVKIKVEPDDAAALLMALGRMRVQIQALLWACFMLAVVDAFILCCIAILWSPPK